MKHFKKLCIGVALSFVAVLPFLYRDYGSSEYPELNQAIRVVRYISAERQLRSSTFRVVYPEGGPKQFVKWIFSPMGSALWPPTEGGLEFSAEELKMLQKTGIPVLPSGVSLMPEKVDAEGGRQLVMRGDDERQVLIVEGYLDPQATSVLVKEWQFPLGDTK